MAGVMIIETEGGFPIHLDMHGGDTSYSATMSPLPVECNVRRAYFASPKLNISIDFDPEITCLGTETGTWRLSKTDNQWQLEYCTTSQHGRPTPHADPVTWLIDPKNVKGMA